MTAPIQAKVVILGSGPGGYTAAFRAADLLGEGVVLVERYPTLGGVCLNVGCIPSKALLHMASLIIEIDHLKQHGIDLGTPQCDLKKITAFKDKVVGRLTAGLKQMAGLRKVQVLEGEGRFVDSHTLEIAGKGMVRFEHAIIAAGSHATPFPGLPDDPRVMDSTRALQLESVPERLLVIGGGIIGLEMATVYHALGSRVTVVELSEFILPGVDQDVAMPLYKLLQSRYEALLFQTKVQEITAKGDGLWVQFAGEKAPKQPERFDKVLVAIGRRPNGKEIGAEKAGVRVDERGFIPVDKQMRTNVPHIFAIGDIVGNPMLAHKAIPEGRVAAEVIAGKKHYFDPLTIPSVAYTDPEVAWVGLTEGQAKAQKIPYQKGLFPWAASGRALGLGRSEGVTKLLFHKETRRLLGAGIVGVHAGDLISELALAIEMGCEAEDLSLTIHPHPTLSESIGIAAEMFEGTATDLMNKK